MTKIEVDTGYCIFCGICVEACPYSALHMGYSYERSTYRRFELVQSNEGLLASDTRPASAFMRPDNAARLPKQTLLVDKPMSILERPKKKLPPEPPKEENAEDNAGAGPASDASASTNTSAIPSTPAENKVETKKE